MKLNLYTVYALAQAKPRSTIIQSLLYIWVITNLYCEAYQQVTESEQKVKPYILQFILLLLSAITSSVNISYSVQ